MFVKGTVLGYLFLLMTSCTINDGKSTSVSIDKEQIKKEIQARENEFAEIYNSGELKKIGYYADDAVTFYQNMAPIRGKAERFEFQHSVERGFAASRGRRAQGCEPPRSNLDVALAIVQFRLQEVLVSPVISAVYGWCNVLIRTSILFL